MAKVVFLMNQEYNVLMFKIFKYLKPYLWQLIIMALLTYLQVTMNLELPEYMAHIVNDGIAAKNESAIWSNGYWMLGATLVGAIATVISSFFASRIGTGFAMTLRAKVFQKVESFSLTEFNKFSTASLITRTTNDINQVQTVLILVFRLLLMAPLTAIGAVFSAYAIAPNMTWIMWLAVGVLLSIIGVLFAVLIPKFSILQKVVDKLNLVSRQNLTGIRVIRAFNTQDLEERKFNDVNLELTALNLFVNRAMSFLQPVMILILNLTMIAVIWIGGHQVADGNLTIGNMMAFIQYSTQVIFSFLMISIVFTMIPRATVSAKRISEVLDTEPTIRDPKFSRLSEAQGSGLIEFKNVSFKYPGADQPVLQNISFIAKPGQTTAFIGSTGSGKSTIINLIPRFFDITSGEILIDGINIQDITQAELHSKIGFVPQKSILFSGTIESNIKFGTESTSESELETSAKISQSYDFIQKLNEKFDAPVSQGGTNFSGGQKQRLSIARALMVNPEIYIFDDSFSALDFKTDKVLREQLKKVTIKSTVLIVAQRIGTILDADQIIVLEEGKIVGVGNHSELLKSNKIYQEIANSQLSEKELSEIGN